MDEIADKKPTLVGRSVYILRGAFAGCEGHIAFERAGHVPEASRRVRIAIGKGSLYTGWLAIDAVKLDDEVLA